MSPRPQPDGGETLIELLVSMVIMGIAGAAIIGSLLVAVDVSQMHKRQVQVQQYLRSWAEAVSNNSSDAGYCTDSACFLGMAPAAVGGLSPSVEGIECWTDSGWASGCGTRDDVRRVKLTVAGGGSMLPVASRSLSVVVRKACAAGSSC
jgi:hypothetical protein